MNSLTTLLPPIQKARSFSPFRTEWPEALRLWGQEIFPGARLEFARGEQGLKFRFIFTPEVDPTKSIWLQALMTMGRGLVTSKLFQFNAREVDSFLRVSALEPCLALDQNDLIKWDRELRKTLLMGYFKAHAQQYLAGELPAKHVYVEITHLISSWLAQLGQGLDEFLVIELVCIELKKANQALKGNRVVVSIKQSQSLNEFFPEKELLLALEEVLANQLIGSSLLPLKWVAEGRDLP